MRGVLAPLTNVLGRTRRRSLSPSSSDSDANSDSDEDIQPVGARIGHDYTPRPICILRSSFRYKLELADGTTRTENEIDVERLRASDLRPESLVYRRSYWNSTEGRAHASLVSSRLLPKGELRTKGDSLRLGGVITMLKYGAFSRTILSGPSNPGTTLSSRPEIRRLRLKAEG